MNLKRIIIGIIFVSIIVSCNVAFASDFNENNTLSADLVEISSDNSMMRGIDDNSLEESSNFQITSNNECIVFVGTNSTPDGKGTEEDPFATLELACNNVNSDGQKDKVTVNINEGTYYIGSYLKFNTLDLNIVGNGSVTLKNLYSDSDKQQSFGLLPQQEGNFTMSNIIFDASDYNINANYEDIDGWFTPFVNSAFLNTGNPFGSGFDDLITINNCKFVGYDNKIHPIWIMPQIMFVDNDKFVFNNCKFGKSTTDFGAYFVNHVADVRFNYCTFSEFSQGLGIRGASQDVTVAFDSCWLGHNNGYTSTFFMMATYNPGYLGDIGFDYRDDFLKNSLYANRHAVLVVSENYLGGNTYEIAGKLIWSDGTEDNIDKLGPMAVYLSADNGIIPSTAILENGTFNVTYTSDSDYHEIVVVLDGQKIKLNNKINFTLNAPTITYGDNQNITVTFPTNVKGTVYVTVNNNTYHKYVDDQNNATVSIDDILAKGNYPVQVSFAYDKNEYDIVSPASNSNYYTVEEIDVLVLH